MAKNVKFETYASLRIRGAILDEIRKKEISYKDEIVRITMTFGICQGSTDDMDDVIRMADSKLYEGKAGGRNQIVQ